MINLKKDNWIETDIGSVSQEINEKVLNPTSNDCDKFVRPEDLEIGELYVKSFRKPEDVGSGKYCYSGDILFARRSVSVSQFKRRSSIIKFDGVCSDEITVVRQDNLKLFPEFLNLILNTENLWDFAIARSVGSVSKRIKWEDLAKYKFKFPKKNEDQKQIASLFQSIETAIEQVDGQEKNLKVLWKRLLDEFVSDKPSFGNLLKGNKLKTYNYCDVTIKLMRKIDPLTFGIERIVAGENLESEDFKIRTWQKVGEGYLGPAFHVLFKAGDILYGSRRTYLRKVSHADFDGVCANTTYVIRANEELLLQDLLKHIMLSERFTRYSIGVSKGSTNPYINWKDLDNFSFQVPDLETQREIVNVLDSILEIVEQLKQQKATLKLLKHKLLNEILG